MNLRVRGTRVGWVLGVAVAVELVFAPGVRAQQMSATEILNHVTRHNAERQAALERYTAERTYHFDYSGFGGGHMAELVVHAEYEAPGRKRFTVVAERGSKAFCDKVLMKIVQGEEEASHNPNQGQSELSTRNYDAVLAGQGEMDGFKTWILDVTPKVATKFDYKGRIWVSMDDFGIVRVLGNPAKTPSWLVNEANFDYHYQRIGMFWLPASNTSDSHVRLGGEGHLTISYGKYAIEQRPGKDVQTARLAAMGR